MNFNEIEPTEEDIIILRQEIQDRLCSICWEWNYFLPSVVEFLIDHSEITREIYNKYNLYKDLEAMFALVEAEKANKEVN